MSYEESYAKATNHARLAAHVPECICARCEDGREWIAAQGLHVVTAADKARLDALTFTTGRGETFTHCTMAERAVLDAMYAIADSDLRMMARGEWCGHGQEAAKAEMAKRGIT